MGSGYDVIDLTLKPRRAQAYEWCAKAPSADLPFGEAADYWRMLRLLKEHGPGLAMAADVRPAEPAAGEILVRMASPADGDSPFPDLGGWCVLCTSPNPEAQEAASQAVSTWAGLAWGIHERYGGTPWETSLQCLHALSGWGIRLLPCRVLSAGGGDVAW